MGVENGNGRGNGRKIMAVPVKMLTDSRTAVRVSVILRDNRECVYCKREGRTGVLALNLHHVIPRSKGGTYTYNNLVAACYGCNQNKKDDIPPATEYREIQAIIEANTRRWEKIAGYRLLNDFDPYASFEHTEADGVQDDDAEECLRNIAPEEYDDIEYYDRRPFNTVG